MKNRIITLAVAFVVACTMIVAGNTVSIFADTACAHETVTNETKSKNATCTSPAIYKGLCSSCGKWVEQPKGDPLGHDFTKKSPNEKYKKDAATCKSPAIYYYACMRSGCEEAGTETFPLGNPLRNHPYEPIDCVTQKCSYCGKVSTIGGKSHTWVEATCTTPKHCSLCSATEGGIKHNWEDATCVAPKTCKDCGLTDETQPSTGHAWKKTSCTTHECTKCRVKEDMTPDHQWQQGDCKTLTRCKVCLKTKGKLLPHTIVEIPAVPATCMTVGLSAGEKCSVCHTIITPQIPKGTTKHTSMYIETMPATQNSDGKTYHICSVCYYPYDEVKIPRIGKVKMAETVVYNGKAQKPKVKVYNQKGALISSKYYKVTYRKNKEIGNATADIKFSGKYYGTITMKFQVVPKSTSLTKLTKAKKALTAKWAIGKKAQVSGYEIAVSTTKYFYGGTKIVTVKGYKKNSVKVTKLQAKKKYYVRVRTYKTVKIVGRDVKIYSGWSKYKTITTK